MKYVNISLPWMTERWAMVPQLVEQQLKTEQVGLCFWTSFTEVCIRL